MSALCYQNAMGQKNENTRELRKEGNLTTVSWKHML
jgi:hypothetical protein